MNDISKQHLHRLETSEGRLYSLHNEEGNGHEHAAFVLITAGQKVIILPKIRH